MNKAEKPIIFPIGIGMGCVLLCLMWIISCLAVLSIMPGLLTLDRAVLNGPTMLILLVCILFLVGSMMPPSRLNALSRKKKQTILKGNRPPAVDLLTPIKITTEALEDDRDVCPPSTVVQATSARPSSRRTSGDGSGTKGSSMTSKKRPVRRKAKCTGRTAKDTSKDTKPKATSKLTTTRQKNRHI